MQWYGVKMLNEMENKELVKRKYEDACNDYLKLFCEKHGFDYEEAVKSWVADEVGGVCWLSDFAISFEDMKTDIDMDAPKEEYWSYHEYAVEAYGLGFNCPNYKNWTRGCPRLSEEQIESIRKAKNRADYAKDELERIIKEENSKLAKLGGF